MPILRILHLSDLHLAGSSRAFYAGVANSLLSVYNPDALEAITEIIYEWRKELHAIFISGDIAITGAERDLKHAMELFTTAANPHPKEPWETPWLNSEGEPTFQIFDKPIIIVPGNHDRYGNRVAWPGNLFYRYFESYWTAGSGGIQLNLLPNREDPVLAIICSDFTLDNIFHSTMPPIGHFGQGKVYDNRLKELVRLTNMVAFSYPSCAIVWMIHFAPRFCESKKFQEQLRNLKGLANLKVRLMEGLTKLIDEGKLTEEARKLGIKYIFCGHTHVYDNYYVDTSNKVYILCSGSATCVSSNRDTTIHLRDIVIENAQVKEIRSQDLRWDTDNRTFL